MHDLDDVTRFNESIDQSLANAVEAYTSHGDRSRHMFLAILGHDLRGPLSSIMQWAQVAALKLQGDVECLRQWSASSAAAPSSPG